MGRLSRLSLRRSLAVTIALALVSATGANARTFVVRPDGTGDAPTIQAAIDSLIALDRNPNHWPPRAPIDTILVEPGQYPEDIHLQDANVSGVLRSKAGAGSVTLRSLDVFGSKTHLEVQGFKIAESCTSQYAQVSLEDCEFGGPVKYVYGTQVGPVRIARSTFVGPVSLIVGFSSGSARDCVFLDLVTTNDSEGQLNLTGCRFEGTRAGLRATGSYYGTHLTQCSFQGCREPIRLIGYPLRPRVDLQNCRIEGSDRVAIANDLATTSGARVSVNETVIKNCGGGIRLEGEYVDLSMFGDTLAALSGAGVDVVGAGRTTVVASVIRSCNGDGVRTAGQEFVAIQRSRIERNSGSAIHVEGSGETRIAGNLCFGNQMDGVRLAFDGVPPIDSVAGNTLARNGGHGLSGQSVAGDDGSVHRFENNLVAGNGGVGAQIACGRSAIVRHNNAWMNRVGGFAGSGSFQDNLTEDPQFCDAVAGNFYLASSSPCAPSGAYGQIGALGVACAVMAVPVDAQDHPINLRANAAVSASIFGHSLFDARLVEPASVRVSGATPTTRGNSSRFADVNHDGFVDLLMSFESRTIQVSGGKIELEGRTLDGVAFRGSDAVEIKGASPLSTALVEAPRGLALAVTPYRSHLELRIDLPTDDPARLEIFDVSGRRVLSIDLPRLGRGRHQLVVGESLRSGLYFLRLGQVTSVAFGRAVVVR